LSEARSQRPEHQDVNANDRHGNDAATGYETSIIYLGGHVFPVASETIGRQNGGGK
jgi:hypothetical protein